MLNEFLQKSKSAIDHCKYGERKFEESRVSKDRGVPSSMSKLTFLPYSGFNAEASTNNFWIKKEKEVVALDFEFDENFVIFRLHSFDD